MNSKRVVVVTSELDPHADHVILKLRSMGHVPFRLHPEDVPTKARYRLSFNGEKFVGAYQSDRQEISVDDIRSIWWRRPRNAPKLTDVSDAEANFADLEVKKALQGLWGVLDCYWMSHPRRIMDAEIKLDQLNRATKLGFQIPRTLISSDPTEVRQFYETCGRKMIYKVFCRPMIESRTEEPGRAIYTKFLEPDFVEENLHKISRTPCLFQEYIEKAFELRITIIGEQIFVAAINSQAHERTKRDWRHYDVPMLLTKSSLPPDIQDKCFQLVKGYGLNYGAIDMIATPDGRHVFLEINPNGQWRFIEQHIPDFKMTDAMIECLLNGTPTS